MAKEKRVNTDDLATELHMDIARADLALGFRGLVLSPLHSNTEFQVKCRGAHSHMASATLTHVFMTLSRIFDAPTSRFSVTLEQLVERVVEKKGTSIPVIRDAPQHLKNIRMHRKKMARLRNTVFAHKNNQNKISQVSWSDLENVRDAAKKILEWYGYESGHAYSYHVPGFNSDCRRFLKAILKGAKQLEGDGA